MEESIIIQFLESINVTNKSRDACVNIISALMATEIRYMNNNEFILSFECDGDKTNSILRKKVMCACFSTSCVVLSSDNFSILSQISKDDLSKLVKMRVLYNCNSCLTKPTITWNGEKINIIQDVKMSIVNKLVIRIMNKIVRCPNYDSKLITHIIPNCYDRECDHSASYICSCDEDDIHAVAAMITIDGHLPLDMYVVLIEKLRLNCVFINIKCTNCMKPHQCEDDYDEYFLSSSELNYKGSSYEVRYTNNTND